MATSLSNLKKPAGATRDKVRVGRGVGSGLGKTAGRGQKGQYARNSIRREFEGGQTPLARRLPKRGFTNIFSATIAEVNVGTLEKKFDAGATVDDYVHVIERLTNEEGITAFEINASCPNTSAGGLEFGSDPRGLAELVRACRRVSTRPLTIKLSPVLPDIPAMAGVARDEGAEAVTLVNTMPGLLDRRLGNGSGGLSGPALLPIGVLATRRVRERVGMPVIGVGGVRNTADVREYLAAGASLVAIGTAALADPRVPVRIARELAHA